MEQNNTNAKQSTMAKLPVFFLILRIIGILVAVGGITLIALSCTVMGYETYFGTQPNGFALIGGIILTIIGCIGTVISCLPLIPKLAVKTGRFVVDSTKKDAKELGKSVVGFGVESTTEIIDEHKEGIQNLGKKAVGLGVDTATGIVAEHKQAMKNLGKETASVGIETATELVDDHKDDIKNFVATGAEVFGDAISTVATSIKDAVRDGKTCAHCGAKIDANSNFCNYCGGKQ